MRGAGSEQFFNNANPAYNREMFNEAHDFIVQAWTRPGPWRYEGKHFHYRHVNPWALPYQKPHPPMWIPGVLSPETVRWCAEHNYPYIGLGTALQPTCDLWDLYADVAAERGYQAGPENFGYLVPTFVADTEEKAAEIGTGFVYGGGQNAFSRPEHTLPPGYNSKDAIRRLASGKSASWVGLSKQMLEARDEAAKPSNWDEVRQKLTAALGRASTNHTVIYGTPETVANKIKSLMSVIRPGVFIFLHIQGQASNADRMRSIELLSQYVVPEMRDHAREPRTSRPLRARARLGEAPRRRDTCRGRRPCPPQGHGSRRLRRRRTVIAAELPGPDDRGAHRWAPRRRRSLRHV